MSLTSPQQVAVMEFKKRHDTTDLTAPTCYGLATGKLVQWILVLIQPELIQCTDGLVIVICGYIICEEC